jgi:acyl-CoA thioesterase FadM
MPVPVGSLARVIVRGLASRGADPVGRLPWRVHLRHVDVNLHMNYASYLEAMELARWDWAVRTGQHRRWMRDGVRPLVGSLEIEYRRELGPLARVVVETRAIGFDRRALVVEQCFVRGDAVHARSRLNLLFRRKGAVLDRPEVEALTATLIVAPRQ